MEYKRGVDPYNYMFSTFENGKIITTDVGGPIPSEPDGSYMVDGTKYKSSEANTFMQPKSFTKNGVYEIIYYDSMGKRKVDTLQYSNIGPDGQYEFKIKINPLQIENIYLISKKSGGKKTKRRLLK
jgi:hypothetical protein